MSSYSSPRPNRALGLAFALLLTVAPAFAESTWTIAVVGGGETRVRTAGETAEGDPLVDADMVASLLGATIQTRADVSVLTDRSGSEWVLSTDAPVRTDDTLDHIIAGTIVRNGVRYMSLAALARVMHLQVVLSAGTHAYLFPVSSASTGPLPQTAGWTALRVQKDPEELAAMRRQESAAPTSAPTEHRDTELLPPSQGAMVLETGVGYVAGADGAATIDLAGTAGGYRITGNTFLTRGSQGLRYLYGRGSIESPHSAWKMELGDLFGELRGLSRGARVTLRPDSRWSPSAGLLLGGAPGGERTLLSYRDRLAVTSHVETTTEVLSDGSLFLRAAVAGVRGHTDAFYRRDRLRSVEDRGVSGSLTLWQGLSMFAAARASHGRSADRWLRGGFTVPLGRGAQVTLDQTRARTGNTDIRTNAASLHLPFGRLQLFQRFQAADNAFIDGSGIDANYRQAQSSASYAVSRRLQLSYQAGTQWLRDGDARQFSEMQAAFTLSARTTIRVTSGIPDVLDSSQLTVRASHDLSHAWNLNAEYGRVSPFQAVSRADADARRLALFVTRRFRMRTAAGGGTVEGRVLDQAGRPVAGALVRVGPYAVSTDASGTYRVNHVPGGPHALALDPERLPAGYVAEPQRDLVVRAIQGRTVAPPLHAISVQSVAGRVCVDRNASGTCDADEGVGGVVLLAGARATSSDDHGDFGFFNLAPGRHSVSIDLSRLRNGLVPVGSSSIEVEIGVQPVDTIEFRLAPRAVPIRMQPWPGR